MRTEVPLIAASLSGVADRTWARRLAPLVSRAMLGGIAVDPHTRAAAEALRARGRAEFLPPDPLVWAARMTRAPRPVPMGLNIRARSAAAVRAVAGAVDTEAVWVELNAHCRQPEMCAAGAGEQLLREHGRLAELTEVGASCGATMGVKVRAEVPGVELVSVARTVEAAGGAFIHLDAMDDPTAVARVAAETELEVIANNGIRTRADVVRARDAGAAAVSVGRPSTDPTAVAQIATACAAAPPRP
jgi:TIM-barrel protein